MLVEGTYKNIRLQIVQDKEAVANHFAEAVVEIVRQNNARNRPTCLIMPVGPTGQYRLFAQLCNREGLDLSRLHVFNMDECVGNDGNNLPDEHPLSFEGFPRKNFYTRIFPECHMNLNQMHVPDARKAAEFSRAIEAVGGIDLCFGGIGINDHLAFNEALDYWELISNEDFKTLPTRVVKIATTTKVVNAVSGIGGNLQATPNFAVTAGMKEILAGRKIQIYLDWPWQKQVLRNTLFGLITPMFPASFLRERQEVAIVAAACVADDPVTEAE